MLLDPADVNVNVTVYISIPEIILKDCSHRFLRKHSLPFVYMPSTQAEQVEADVQAMQLAGQSTCTRRNIKVKYYKVKPYGNN